MNTFAFPTSPDMRRAPTKTIAFTGGAALGLAGTAVPVWTVTGRVMLVNGSAFCTETCVSTLNLGTISLGTTSLPASLIDVLTVGAGTLAANDWWGDAGGTTAGLSEDFGNVLSGSNFKPLVSESIIISPATQNITDGTLVLDCWYVPITAGASLS